MHHYYGIWLEVKLATLLWKQKKINVEVRWKQSFPSCSCHPSNHGLLSKSFKLLPLPHVWVPKFFIFIFMSYMEPCTSGQKKPYASMTESVAIVQVPSQKATCPECHSSHICWLMIRIIIRWSWVLCADFPAFTLCLRKKRPKNLS